MTKPTDATATNATEPGATPDSNNTNGATPEAGATPESELTFEAWLTQQEEPVKKLVDGRLHKLSSALDTERDDRKALARQLRDATKQAEDGSELRKQLDAINEQITEHAAKADFFEEAHGRHVSNLRLAYLAAKSGGLISERGKVDWDALKTGYPELFTIDKPPAPPRGNAGSGTGRQPETKPNMNDWIRQAAGLK